MITYSIIKKSQLEGAKRLDAEYYQPEFLSIISKIKSLKSRNLIELAEKVFSGPFGSTLKSDSYQKSGIPFIRIGNIVDVFIENENLVYISEKEHKRIYSTHLKTGDIVLSKIGTVGRLSVIDDNLKEVNISENNIGIRLQNINEGLRSYILFFLLTKFGQLQILQKASGNIQLKLNVEDIENIVIPLFKKDNDYTAFLNYYSKILEENNNSNFFYQQAENLLLGELKISEKDLDNQLSCVINLSEAKAANRFDAEYFEPKYQKIIEHIKKKLKWSLLDNLASVKKGFEPGAESYREDGKQFIRVSSLSKYEISDSEQKCLSDELYDKLKADYQPQKGEILLTKDASPGIAYVLKEDIEGIISSGILRLKLKNKEIEDEYLALCLNSIIGKMQAERDAGGSVIMHWKPEEIKNVIIPILPKPIQQKISSLVRRSFESRIKAKVLLEEAKKRVEETIEKS